MPDPTPAPADWYPDAERPGQLRWWDGTAWTEHRHDAPQPAPQPTPAPVVAPAAVPVASANPVSPSNAVVCPVCGRTDAIRSIRAIISEGTTHTSGGSVTNVGGLTSSGESFSGSGYTSHSSTSMTGLASRLEWYSSPGGEASLGWFFLGAIVGAGCAALAWLPERWGADTPGWYIFALIFSFLGGGILGGILLQQFAGYVRQPADARAKSVIDPGGRRYLAAYYCLRDDVSFEPGVEAAAPIAFKDSIYAWAQQHPDPIAPRSRGARVFWILLPFAVVVATVALSFNFGVLRHALFPKYEGTTAFENEVQQYILNNGGPYLDVRCPESDGWLIGSTFTCAAFEVDENGKPTVEWKITAKQEISGLISWTATPPAQDGQ